MTMHTTTTPAHNTVPVTAAQPATDRPPKRERGMNKLFLLGRIGREPDAKYTHDGTLVVTTSLGVNTYPNAPADWFTLVFWRNTGELALQLLEKGARVQVEGHLRVKAYVDVRTNERKVAHQVEVIEFVIVDYPNSNNRSVDAHSERRAPSIDKVEGEDLAEFAAQVDDLPL